MDKMLANLDLEVEIAARRWLDENWRSDDGLMPHGRIYYILDGTGFVQHRGRRYIFHPGNIYLIPAHTPLRFGAPGAFHIFWVHYRAVLQGGIDLFDYLDCAYEITPREPQHARHISERMLRLWKSGAPEEQFELNGMLLQLLAPFVATADPAMSAIKQADLQRFRPVLERIDNNLSSPPSLAEMAELAHLERSYFSRAFLRRFGQSPARYALKRRIEEASHLLLRTNDTLEAIAAKLGFAGAFHLSKAFKRIIGSSPRDYRKRAPREGP